MSALLGVADMLVVVTRTTSGALWTACDTSKAQRSTQHQHLRVGSCAAGCLVLHTVSR